MTRRFTVDLPANQALVGAHVGPGSDQLPADGNSLPGYPGFVVTGRRVSAALSSNRTEVDIIYTPPEQSFGSLDRLATSYYEWNCNIKSGTITIPFIRKVFVGTTTGGAQVFAYPRVDVDVARPEVVMELTINFEAEPSAPTAFSVLRQSAGQAGKIHTLFGEPNYLFEGATARQVSADRLQVTYSWLGVSKRAPLLFTNGGLPDIQYLQVPQDASDLLPHETYLVVPGEPLGSGEETRPGEPAIVRQNSYELGDVNALAGLTGVSL